MREYANKSVNDIDSFSYKLMMEQGDLIDRRVVNNIDSLIIRTESDLSDAGTDEESSAFLVVPVELVHKLIETSDKKEIDLGGKSL